MKPTKKPTKKTEMWTNSGRRINPLNVVSTNLNIKDVAVALSHQPMFGGHSHFHYSKAQHACMMHDILKANLWEYLLKIYKDPDCIQFGFNDRAIVKQSLLYYAGHAYLEPIMGEFNSFRVHNSRVIAAVADIIGQDYNVFLNCKKLYEYLDNDVKKEWYDRFYENNDRYNEFWCHLKAREQYLERIKL